MQRRFFALFLAVFLAFSLVPSARAAESVPDEGSSSEAQTYAIVRDSQNGEINISDLTPDEWDFYYQSAGQTVSFSLSTEEGFVLKDSVSVELNDYNSNPVVITRDYDGNATGTVALSYDETSGLYSFTMPESAVLIAAHFEDPASVTPPAQSHIISVPYGGVAEIAVNLLTVNESGESIATQLIPDSDGWCYAQEGDLISFSATYPTGYSLLDSVSIRDGDKDLTFPNPSLIVRGVNGIESFFTPDYDAINGVYTFTMPDSDVYLYMDFGVNSSTTEPGIPRYVSDDAINGSITFINLSEDEFGYYAYAGAPVSFSVSPEEGYVPSGSALYAGESLEGNPLAVLRDDYGEITGTVELSYDENTGLYSFTMPDDNVLVLATFEDPAGPAYSLVVPTGGETEYIVTLLTPNEDGEGFTATQLTPDEYGFVEVHEGDLISVSVNAPEGYVPDSEIRWEIDEDTTLTFPNPSLLTFDEDGIPSAVGELIYDEATNSYSFTMPAMSVNFFCDYIPGGSSSYSLSVPYGSEIEYIVTLLTPNEDGEGYTATQLTPDEYGLVEVNEGDLISISVNAPEGYTPESEVRIYIDEETSFTFPNPSLLKFNEDGLPEKAADLVYDEETNSYSFTMPADYVGFYMDYTGPEYYWIINSALNGTVTLIDRTAYEETYYAEADETVYFSITPDEGFHAAEGFSITVGDNTTECSNPSILVYDENYDIADIITPDYDSSTKLYSFKMPASNVSIWVDFHPNQEGSDDPDSEKLFIGRNPGEGGTIEFIDNETWSADEGDKVPFKVIPDKGYAIDEVRVIKAKYVEDGSIETIDGEYLDAITKNEDGSYTFTMPDSPVQIIASFKPLYVSTDAKLSYTKGSKKPVVATFKRAVDDASCYSHFAGKVEVGGKEAKRGEAYTDASGSTVITFSPDYLESLSTGDHDVRVVFDDGEVTVPLSIAAATNTSDGGTTAPGSNATQPATDSPATGDTGNLILWFTLMALTGAGMFGTAILRKKNYRVIR